MKHHLCVVTSDTNVIRVIQKAFAPLGIDVDHVESRDLLDGELGWSAKVTLVDLESFDNLPHRIWDNLRGWLSHTLCVPLIAHASNTVYRQWFGTPLKTLTKPLTASQLRWLVFQCVGRLKSAASRPMPRSKTESLICLKAVLRHQHPEKSTNQNRVGNLVNFISQRCRIDPLIGNAITSAAGLYDLGILLEKPIENSLRMNRRRRRTFYSAAIAKFSGESPEVVRILRNLDENWDGTGLPNGKKRSEIPIGARMLRIAVDFLRLQYDSDLGLYLSANESAAWIRDAAEKIYDPELVQRFLDHLLENKSNKSDETLWVCGARNLISGMILSEDLFGRDGLMLLSKGKVLNEHLVSRLIDYEERFCIRDGLFAGVQNRTVRDLDCQLSISS
jgi:hypothetical protein